MSKPGTSSASPSPVAHWSAVAGYLLAAAITGTILHTFGGWPRLPAALLIWAAGLLLWPHARVAARRQAGLLMGIGGAGMAWAWLHGVTPDWRAALETNTLLITMLAAVTFLRLLVPAGQEDRQGMQPRGPRALAQTLLSTHLFGAVINLSAVFITGDHMQRNGRLTPRQSVVLARGFATAAFWSPFFAAMATVLVYVPGASPHTLMIIGIPLAAAGLLVTLLQRGPDADAKFAGYPMRLATLRLPALLAVAVLTLHGLHPAWPLLGIIALLAPVTAVLYLLRRPVALGAVLQQHLGRSLPRMVNELWLFLAAGVMATGLASVLATFDPGLPFTRYGSGEAALTLGLMLLVSLVGIHPAVSIAVFGTLLMPITTDPNLLGATFLAAWAIGVTCSPFSGLNLALQGHYRLRGRDLMRWNARYALAMYGIACAGLWLYETITARFPSAP